MKKLRELMMILDLHRQGVNIAAIARQVGVDRKTVRKYIARGVEVPTYGLGNRGNGCWTHKLNICERDWTPILG